jgi:hypothetical protein
MDENFLLLFRYKNPLESSVEFMKVGQWCYKKATLMATRWSPEWSS